MKYKAVIYDLDGTLLYTLDDLRNSVNYALEKFGHPLRTTDEIRLFIGNGVAVLMRRSAPAHCTDEEVKEMLDVFREHYLKHMYDNTRAYDGVLQMMKDIHDAGILSAIVSNKLDPAVKELDKLFFNGLTTTAIGAPPEAKKPDPTSVYMCMDTLGIRPSEAIYVGDTDVDIETAHNAGIKCIGVSWGFRGRKFLEDYKCDYIIDKPEELLPLLKSL
jgi:phosphoglycolate phosphatase